MKIMLNKQKNYVFLNILTLECQANRILSFIGVKIFRTVASITLKLALKVCNVQFWAAKSLTNFVKRCYQ